MKHYLSIAGLALGTMTGAAFAETKSVSLTQNTSNSKSMIVVELFTSQGCYSCPPADEILTKLATQDDVIALGMHVDYWDYLGWKDAFAIPKFGERQASYNAQIIKRSRRVTPQMIFNGVAEVAGGVGRSEAQIYKNIKVMRNWAEAAALDMTREGNKIAISLKSLSGKLGKADLNLVHYSPSEKVKIDRGENAGKTIEYTNIVKSLEKIGEWDGKSDATMAFDLPQTGKYALIVQGRRFGPVFVARRLP